MHCFSLLEYTITATLRHKEEEKRKIQQTINEIDEQIALIKDITLKHRCNYRTKHISLIVCQNH